MMSKRQQIAIYLFLTVIGSIAYLTLLAIDRADHRPRLIGYNCEGATGNLYANYEDELPVCERIEPNR